jgi:hypothetical protein
VGPYSASGSSCIKRRGERGGVAGVAAADIEAIEQNLEGLTMHVPDATMDDIPRYYQRHTMGVSASIGRILHRVARALACYIEKHP